MAIQVVKFSRVGGRIQNWKDFSLKIIMLKKNYWILRIGVMGSCQKVPNVKNHRNLSQFHFFSLKNINFAAHFLWLAYLIKSAFKSYFLKWCPTFDISALHQFSKFNNFLWVCWFLGKNIFNFVSPTLKLDNPYWHSSLWLQSLVH